MENVKWYSSSQVSTAKHVSYPQLTATVLISLVLCIGQPTNTCIWISLDFGYPDCALGMETGHPLHMQCTAKIAKVKPLSHSVMVSSKCGCHIFSLINMVWKAPDSTHISLPGWIGSFYTIDVCILCMEFTDIGILWEINRVNVSHLNFTENTRGSIQGFLVNIDSVHFSQNAHISGTRIHDYIFSDNVSDVWELRCIIFFCSPGGPGTESESEWTEKISMWSGWGPGGHDKITGLLQGGKWSRGRGRR